MNRHELSVEELTMELRALRETPSQEFAATLDARATAGFPRTAGRMPGVASASETASRAALRAGALRPRRLLLPALAGAASVIIVATAVVVSRGGGTGGDSVVVSSGGGTDGNSATKGDQAQRFELNPPSGVAGSAAKAAPAAGDVIAPGLVPPGDPGSAPGIHRRQVERSAELTLGTDPDQVQDVAAKTIDVVSRYRGIVLSSSVRDGARGEAGASFDLLIPSARLSGALGDLSGLADVRSRSENTLDITAPFVSGREHLRDARAEAEGLLRQLADAVSDRERASVKAQLRIVRGRIAAFRSQVNRLERRANFSRVSLDIVTDHAQAGVGSGGGDWTIGDALHDAGRVLAVAAGVALLGAALILPLALLGGATWAARRIYLRRARAQALGA